MKNLFESATVEEVKERMAQLRPDSERLWGKMNPAQALAHCSAAMEMALGEKVPPRNLIGRLLGRLAKKSMIVNEKPMPRNSATDKSLVVKDERDFAVERQRLREFIDHFAAGGPGVCTKHPHFFFGPLTPVEWAALMYQHLDHHLRQFRV
jgi:transposase InsO family protein